MNQNKRAYVPHPADVAMAARWDAARDVAFTRRQMAKAIDIAIKKPGIRRILRPAAAHGRPVCMRIFMSHIDRQIRRRLEQSA